MMISQILNAYSGAFLKKVLSMLLVKISDKHDYEVRNLVLAMFFWLAV